MRNLQELTPVEGQRVESEMKYEIMVRGKRKLMIIRSEVKNRVSESLVTVKKMNLELTVEGKRYLIPVKVDTLNLDDRDYNGHSRGYLFYVVGYPHISQKHTGIRNNDDVVFAEGVEGFKLYLIDAIKEFQKGEMLDTQFDALSQFEVGSSKIAAE